MLDRIVWVSATFLAVAAVAGGVLMLAGLATAIHDLTEVMR